MSWVKRHYHTIAIAVMFGLLLFTALHCGPSLLSQEPAKPQSDPEGFYLPIGNVQEGKKVFEKFKCHTCHVVYFDRFIPQPTAEKPGPVLGDLKRMHTPGEFANAIVSPSRHIMTGFEPSEGKQSRMGDFGQTMTVQELVDIVAYLMAQEE
jgi:hypothetical protein